MQPLATPGSSTSALAQPTYQRDLDFRPRASRQYEEPNSPVARVPSRRLEHDDQDLRRIASLQYARRPYSPTGVEPYQVPEIRQVCAASHTFAERPVERVFREASMRPAVATQHFRERSISPGREYRTRPQSPGAMAPPRRIVVDQFGNQYIATPADEPLVPPSRLVEVEPYYERAVTREPTMRAPIRTELYEDDAQRMPPPPTRRYIEAPDAEIETRVVRTRAASRRPAEGDYPGREVLERRPTVQYEEMGPRGGYMPLRSYSVRPEIVRREVPGEYNQVRHESIQPNYVRVAAPRYREVSVVQAEPYDDRRYTYVPASQVRRYGDGEGERPLEANNGTYSGEARRVSYR